VHQNDLVGELTRVQSNTKYKLLFEKQNRAFNLDNYASHASKVTFGTFSSLITNLNTIFLGFVQQSGGSAMTTLERLARFSFDSNVGPNLAPTPTYSLFSTPSIQVGTFT